MRLDDVEELYAFMLEKRILACEAEGVKLILDPSALPIPVMVKPDGAKEPGWDEEIDQETPQERIRREFMENHGIVNDDEVIE